MTNARAEAFRHNPMIMGFLSTALQDLQLTEFDEACMEDREERDSGTIYDCPDETFERAKAECEAFWAILREDVDTALDATNSLTSEHIGSDLYLERAGHGAGFRDRSYSETETGERLSAMVDQMGRGSVDVYFGDDGKAYFA
ncbi:hypothetical protein [Sphingomonas sp. TREG-RG-20F-R18-01]|uniref:hypothetical protein n=1 Tax=Sphingomonas sp. TREG-RG-20F-R18-01 TaxID=2914982 RepID=UPI001F5813BA|nr:hypothetical protein [Sphingomonas sp. TREG-RG-20F-R18-01]